jgi:hypothetical protein
MQIGKERTFNPGICSVTATLLLEQELQARWGAYLKQHKITRAVHLRLLIENYATRVVGEKGLMHDRTRSCYQVTGILYIRRNVKVNWNIWSTLQALARGVGLSTCHLVALLLEMDLCHKPAGVPTDRVFPRHNTIHRLTVVFELELTKPYLRRSIAYERCPRNARIAETLATLYGYHID